MKHIKVMVRKLDRRYFFAAVFVVIGLATLFYVRAATQVAYFEAENSALSTNASVITDTTASGGSAIQFNAPSQSQMLMGWQLTSTNVGLAPHGLSCASLPAYTGSLKPAAGARISNVRINGNLDLSNGDIEIDKSCIRPASGDNRALVSNDVCGANECVVQSSKSVIIRDSEFDGDFAPASGMGAACAFRGIGTLQRNYIHGMGSGICFFGTGLVFDGLAENNYVTGLRSYADSHNEAGTVRDFRKNVANTRKLYWLNNRLDCQSGNVTAGLFIQTTWVDIFNVWVQGNYIEGEGFNLYVSKGDGVYGNLHSVNNRFRPTGWGPSVVDGGGGPWTEWVDNYLYDPTKPDAKGAVVNP